MVGGATLGYCATGSCVMEMAPSTIMNRAMTHAKMGRSIKNLAMRQLSSGFSARLPKLARQALTLQAMRRMLRF